MPSEPWRRLGVRHLRLGAPPSRREAGTRLDTPATQTDTPVHPSSFGCITIPFLLIALVPLMWGARGRWQDGQLLRTGEVVEGRVTAVERVPSNPTVRVSGRGESRSAVSPTVAFVTRTGEQRTTIGSVNRAPAPWSVGDTVAVVYDPDDPVRADLRTELERWQFWFVIWSMVGGVLLAIAMLPVVLLVRQKQRIRRAATG